jgi:23S rRNA (pseudouridine1915-N3)-methyltransferase
MNITILCVGKLKEKYWTEAAAEYRKRLSRYCTITVEELKEENPEAEGQNILKRLKKDTFVITLEIHGKALSSEELSSKLQELALEGKSDITFVIGGSDGLSEEVSRRSDLKLSFSRMTFPHQMIRIFLLEQIYRSFKIMKGETYHK